MHIRKHETGQQRRWSTSVKFANHGIQSRATDPESAALIPEDISPSASTRGAVRGVAPVGDRAGPRHDHNAGLLTSAGDESDERVVHDKSPGLESDPPHDAPHRGRVDLAVHTRDSEADGVRLQVPFTDRLLHDRMEDLLDLQLSCGLQVRSPTARLRHDVPLLVGKEADGLRPTGIDAQDMHPARNGTFDRVSSPFADARDVLLESVGTRAFPAAVIEVGTSIRPLWREAFGTLAYGPMSPPARDDTIFDLASLTKVIATVPLVMRLLERGRLELDDAVSVFLSSWRGADREAVTIRDLLSHSSGLPAHESFYLTLQGREAIQRAICATPLDYIPGTQSVYSDLGFMLLGFILSDVASLDVQFDALRTQMQNPEELQFHPPETWKPRTAPTRLSEWRSRLLVGEVDDDNAWALGGAAGHAGLFGTSASVGTFARHTLQVLSGRTGAFQPETMRLFATRSGIPGSSRALGWDTMLPTSSCGTRMSARAFGHTGFTGTSLWIDPESDVYVVLLTNRVHPDGSNNAIQDVRRGVHDAVMVAIAAS